MTFRLTHIHDYHRFIAVDLGIYRVRVGIYNVSEGVISCIGFSSVRQSRKNFSDGMIMDIAGIAQTVDQAILQAGQLLETIPEDVIMSFPSNMFVSDIVTTQYSRNDQDAALNMQEIDIMIKRTEKASYERARKKNQSQFGTTSDDLKLISSTIISIQIDGRNVSSPIGFTGSRVRLTVLNVFVPSGEFNIMRSITSRLDKRIISLIPEPLILPKLIEESEVVFDTACLIDIGYAHTTITVTCKNEILGFEVFPFGIQVLMDQIMFYDSSYSLLQIENILCSSEEFKKDPLRECLDDFLIYIRDTLFAYLQTEHRDRKFGYMLLHGSIFENSTVFSEFGRHIDEALGYEVKKKSLHDTLEPAIAHDRAMIEGLSLMAKELLLVKKDPLVRILRYVLYQYE